MCSHSYVSQTPVEHTHPRIFGYDKLTLVNHREKGKVWRDRVVNLGRVEKEGQISLKPIYEIIKELTNKIWSHIEDKAICSFPLLSNLCIEHNCDNMRQLIRPKLDTDVARIRVRPFRALTAFVILIWKVLIHIPHVFLKNVIVVFKQ